MENEVTATPADKTPEQIEQEMAQTRESLTGKVAALENQVVGSVQTAADTLTGTVESVKSLLTGAPGAVSDTVKQAASAVSEKMKEVFDITGHVRAHPWASVGVSTGLGFLTGLLLFRGRESAAPVAPVPMYAPPAAPPVQPAPGVFDELVGLLGQKVRQVAETVIHSAGAAVNKTVESNVPKLVDAAANRLTPDLETPTPDPFHRSGNGFRG